MSVQLLAKGEETPKTLSIPEFEAFFGIHYLRTLEFADWEAERWIRKRCLRAYKKGKIGSLGLWLGKFHAKQIASTEIPDISIRWIGEVMGYGAFTNRPLKKWEYVGEYIGLVRRRNLLFKNINDYCFMYPREWIATRAYTIDSETQGNFTRFINHSDTPNCESISVYYEGTFHVIFRAIQAIPAGAELTYDYGHLYWQRRKKFRD